MDREQILSYFDLESGLRCLPNCIKSLHVPMVAALSDDELADFWQNRLRLVVEVIEPLAHVPKHPFAENCIRLQDVPDIEHLAEILGQEICEERMFLKWANALQHSHPICLMCVAAFWSRPPNPSEGITADKTSVALILAALCLDHLGRSEDAVMLLESYLGLRPEHYTDPDTLLSRLQQTDSPLHDLSPENVASLLTKLAGVLGFVAGRGSGEAALLLDSYLVLRPEHYADPDMLLSRLQRTDSPLHDLSPDIVANLLETLAFELGFLSGRGSSQATLLLESYLGLRPEHYADADVLLSRLQRTDSPLSGMLRDNAAIFLRTLAKALGLVAGRGKGQAAVLLESYLGLQPKHYVDADALLSRLRRADSPLQHLRPINAANLLKELADALGFLAGRGSGQSAMLLESYLGLRPEHYADADTLLSRLQLADSPLHDLPPDNVALLLDTLAISLDRLGRSEDASLLLESYLGLLPEHYADANVLAFQLQRADSPLHDLAWDNVAIVLRGLADALRFAAGRGSGQSTLLLESYLGLRPEHYADADTLLSRLQRTNSPLQHLSPYNAASLLVTLADALGSVVGRGSGQAALLLQGYLELRPEHFADAEALAFRLQRADSPLHDLAPNNVATLLLTLAGALSSVAGRESGKAAILLESYLGLRPEHYADADVLAFQLQRADSPLHDLAWENVANLLRTLADALRFAAGRGSGQAAMLLESYLGLRPEHYIDPDTLLSRLQRTDSPLQHLHPSSASLLLAALADVLGRVAGQSEDAAAMLLESYLGLRPEHYADADVLAFQLQRADSPLQHLHPNNAAVFLRSLAAALGHAGREQNTRLVLQVCTGGDWTDFIAGLVTGDVHVMSGINILMVWLIGADELAEETLDVCERAVWLVHNVRDKQLPTYKHVVDFLETARKLWERVKRVILTRIAVHRQARRMRELEADERRLMAWAEQFENRLLFERLLTYAPKGSDGASLVDGWDPDQWGLRVPWDFDSLQKRLAVKTAMFEPFPAQSTGLLPMALASCLRQDGDTSRAMAAPSGQQTPQSARNRQELLNRDLQNLHELVPRGTIWLRGLFDDEDSLNWWASRADGADLQILARGQGTKEARQRLLAATQTLDMGIERIWAMTLSSAVPADYLEVLNSLPSYLDGPPLAIADRQNLVQVTKRVLAELRQRSMHQLAGLGDVFLQQLMKEVTAWPGYLEIWAREMEAMRTPWPERTACDVARRTGDVSVLSQGMRALDQRRRNELDRLSDEHLTALQQELDLTPLWEATGEDFPWAQTDVIFTMPGPLLAMPLAWLDVGGQPLFRRAASTSTVCSLTLRDWSAEKREAVGEVSRQLLSAHWDEPDARQHATGLPYLHKQLREIGPSEGWTIWSMGDEPRLTRENFIAGLNDPRQQFGAVVVGAHGNAHRAGVRLALPEDLNLGELSESAAADVRERLAHWCGEEADLSSVDLLILVCCAVGRLNQEGDRDVEGLYAQLVGQGASSVIAARWPIADVEAADFTAEIVREYMQSLGENRQPAPFDRARAFNRARITMLDRNDHRHVTFHQAAAFELYGLG